MFGKIKKMNLKLINRLALLVIALIVAGSAMAQVVPVDRCGTMTVLKAELEKNPALKDSMDKLELKLQTAIRNRLNNPNARVDAAPIYIPVVFHIVMTDPTQVTDEQINAQLNVLNEDYAGLNADSTIIPAYFKPYFGKSRIRFVLAKRNASNQPSTGIERIVTTQTEFSDATNYVKHAANGGANAWDQTRFFNVWVCNLRPGLLGYATFPGQTPSSEQGVAISYMTLPGGSATGYNKGRTLTHESGHYFNLYHIWGDDNGACTGTDYVNDTPDQGNSTSGCPGGMVTDNCSTAAPGIMYQNYMDYSSDGCMAMFTTLQVVRMETALTGTRAALTTSNGAVSPLKTLDAQLLSIDKPYNRVCDTKFIPAVTIRNYGSDSLKSLDIYASVDGGTAVLTHWTGALASLSATQVTLNAGTVNGYGAHTLKIQLSAPNGGTDLGTANDTGSLAFVYPTPLNPPITEGFENTTFPTAGWDIVNDDASYTWERITGVSKTGSAAVMVRNFNYAAVGQRDYLRLPQVSLTDADSAFMSFQVAAAVQTSSSLFNTWDTLQVLVSTDCGVTYTPLYKKWGTSLVTRSGVTTTAFVPASNEWRKDSVNLTPYINKGPLMIAFVNTTGQENNIYVDDINLYKKINSASFQEQGWQITPNPTTGPLKVTFAATPVNVKGIVLYSSAGEKIAEAIVNSSAPATSYQFDMRKYASGVYVVRIVFNDHVVSRKIVKE